MGETMRAAIFEKPGKISIKDVPMPVIDEDEVLIKVE
jgi:NADPH:quinone reductase-like Zn-dependent oxidoreductase